MARPASADSVETAASLSPHGTMRSNQARSLSQFRAKPCIVTPRETRMPIAPTWIRSAPVPPVPGAAGDPDAAAAVDPRRGHAEVGAGPDQGLLQGADVGDDIDRLAERDDRVADQLAGTMPGDLAAPVNFDHRRAGIADGTVQRAGPLARGIDRLVLE